MDFQDANVKCITCGREFIFTAREQEFFASKGFKEPKHCRECRQRRKSERERAFAEASGQPYTPQSKDAFKVICAQCGRETYVPFKPITGKPVMCKDCFIAQRYGAQAPPQADEPDSTKEKEDVTLEEPGKSSAISEAIPDEGGEIDLAEVQPEVEPSSELDEGDSTEKEEPPELEISTDEEVQESEIKEAEPVSDLEVPEAESDDSEEIIKQKAVSSQESTGANADEEPPEVANSS
ncbi:hypothetical protein CEE37_12435 [candidate division LCP-89 bacterium B3_LCP]|uniref:Uncharacterized protein n=1 Tax=candidate division LCP-89 bacterium B3_LCP TaxID=2012998 RepID=A0A532UUD9_UNCL8|nr:MAG: hypothetical protein CEE37_12435 [candidate division LCP-89 bacterium B3_LCP]